MTFPSEQSINRIFSTILNQKLQDFEEDVKALGEPITQATIEIFNAVTSQLLPTPARIHYLFNLRDISKVFQGVMRSNKEYYDSSDSLAKLWIHEVTRVFGDRLIDRGDRDYLMKVIDEKLVAHMETSLADLGITKRVPIFADIFSTNVNDTFLYEEVANVDKLKQFMESKLEEYNSEPGFVQVDLVLFYDAIDHICRITRVLRQPNGNVFLIGVGGSGRQSLTRLASYLVETKVYQIKISKNYRHVEFRDDLKKIYMTTGIENKPLVFLLTDAQIVNEIFLEDLSNILSSGEVNSISFPLIL